MNIGIGLSDKELTLINCALDAYVGLLEEGAIIPIPEEATRTDSPYEFIINESSRLQERVQSAMTNVGKYYGV